MWKLRLLNFVAARLGVNFTYSSRFFDDKSQTRGRTLWTSPDIGEAIELFYNFHRLTREKTNGTCYLTIEAQVESIAFRPASRTQPGDPGHDDQLPLGLRERLQDFTQDGPNGAGAEETENAETERAAGDRAESGLGAGAEAPADPERPVESVKPKIDLTDLGIK